jgi:hypothetical protein
MERAEMPSLWADSVHVSTPNSWDADARHPCWFAVSMVSETPRGSMRDAIIDCSAEYVRLAE